MDPASGFLLAVTTSQPSRNASMNTAAVSSSSETSTSTGRARRQRKTSRTMSDGSVVAVAPGSEAIAPPACLAARIASSSSGAKPFGRVR